MKKAALLLFCIIHSSHAQQFDVIVVGAGPGGLSAAWELGRRGKHVAVIDMFSVFGGHAVISEGQLSIVDTPLQRSQGIADSPAIAIKDFLEWGMDANEPWVRLYARNSAEEVYEWLTGLGVRFDSVRQPAGNSLPRTHQNPDRGFGIVAPIYEDCLRYPNIEFKWNLEVIRLLQARGSVAGILGRNTRTGSQERFTASSVVLATGGYQGNLSLLKSAWPAGLPFPPRILFGAGVNAKGSGLALGRQVGASTSRLDHQWNYPWGVPDSRFPGMNRGLNVSNPQAIWVNSAGLRFVNETLNARDALKAVVSQPGGTYWMIFDDVAKRRLRVSGTGWTDFSRIEKAILRVPEVSKSAETLTELAQQIGVPPQSLTDTVGRYNEFIRVGGDSEFHRFGNTAPAAKLQNSRMVGPLAQILVPPFYAVQGFPLARKSLGGLVIDLECRVIDQSGRPISSLLAVGEVAGFGGINGRAGLEGTFIGPSLVQGKLAGRRLAGKSAPIEPPHVAEQPVRDANDENCTGCHSLFKTS